MQNIENWKKVAGYETYSVSDLGNVRNDKTKRILQPADNGHGYFFVNLRTNKKTSKRKIHRLVAGAFLPNREKKKYVDLINNDTKNNKLENLRWVTPSQNSQNAKKSKKNTSGIKGVTRHTQTNKWHAKIMLDGILISLGLFDNIDDAKQARIIQANEVFGVFVNKCEIILNV